MSLPYLKSEAKFSDCRKYRYWLFRQWDETKPLAMFIGLNPSTANENDDDPTIKSIVRISKFNGFGGVYMMNCFPLVTPYPKELEKWFYGRLEDMWQFSMNLFKIGEKYEECTHVVCAWGNFKIAADAYLLKKLSQPLFCLGTNKNGSPKHPLYIKSETPIRPFQPLKK